MIQGLDKSPKLTGTKLQLSPRSTHLYVCVCIHRKDQWIIKIIQGEAGQYWPACSNILQHFFEDYKLSFPEDNLYRFSINNQATILK